MSLLDGMSQFTEMATTRELRWSLRDTLEKYVGSDPRYGPEGWREHVAHSYGHVDVATEVRSSIDFDLIRLLLHRIHRLESFLNESAKFDLIELLDEDDEDEEDEDAEWEDEEGDEEEGDEEEGEETEGEDEDMEEDMEAEEAEARWEAIWDNPENAAIIESGSLEQFQEMLHGKMVETIREAAAVSVNEDGSAVTPAQIKQVEDQAAWIVSTGIMTSKAEIKRALMGNAPAAPAAATATHEVIDLVADEEVEAKGEAEEEAEAKEEAPAAKKPRPDDDDEWILVAKSEENDFYTVRISDMASAAPADAPDAPVVPAATDAPEFVDV